MLLYDTLRLFSVEFIFCIFNRQNSTLRM